VAACVNTSQPYANATHSIGSHSHSHRDTYGQPTNSRSRPNTCIHARPSDTHARSDWYGHSHAYPYFDTYPPSNSYSDADACSNTHAYSHAYSHADPHSHA